MSWATIRRAQATLGITRDSGNVFKDAAKGWMWKLPDGATDSDKEPKIEVAQSPTETGEQLEGEQLEIPNTNPTEPETPESGKLLSVRSVSNFASDDGSDGRVEV